MYGVARSFADYRSLVQSTLNADDHTGLYFSADQMLYLQPGTNDRGLTAFCMIGANEGGTTQFDFCANTGLSYQGLIPTREKDVLAIGAAYAEASSIGRDYVQGLKGIFPKFEPMQDYEAVVEGTYSLQLSGFWNLQPDIQWVMHPGVSDQIPNALVIGIKNVLYF